MSNGVASSGRSADSAIHSADARVARDTWWSAMLEAARRVTNYHAVRIDGTRDQDNEPGRSADGPNSQGVSA